MDELNELFEEWDRKRSKLSRLRSDIHVLKETIHDIMNEVRVNTITTDRFRCHRKNITSHRVLKETLSPTLWDELKTPVTYPKITLERLDD